MKTNLLLEMPENIVPIILAILFAAFVFYALREVFLWYYKIPEHLSNQKEIIRLLKKLSGETEESPSEKKP